MSNIIAICGHTCAEKTNVARELSRICGYKVQHPGEAVKSIVKLRKLASAADVPEDFHRGADEATLALVRNAPMTTIVESGFADRVIGAESNVFLVRLHAHDDVRAKRFEHRKVEGGGRTRQLGESVADQDRTDSELRARLYPAEAPAPNLEIDTTDLSVADCARRIWDAFVAAMGDEDVAGPQHRTSPYTYTWKDRDGAGAEA